MAIKTRNEIQIFNHLSIYLATKWKKNHFYMNLVIYLFIYFPHPTPSLMGTESLQKSLLSQNFHFKFLYFGEKFWVKKALVLCNERVMAICIFACYESRHSLILVWWVLLWHRFYVNLRMWEEEVNICLGATTPWKRPLSSPFGRGWGSSQAVDF